MARRSKARRSTVVAIALVGALVASVAAYAAATDFVAQATQATKARTGLQTKWTGPTAGPKLVPGKKIVYIPTDSTNPLSKLWGDDLQKIGKRIGWKVTVIDGKGTSQGWLQAMTQAIALKPDGIATSADMPSLQGPIGEGVKQGIVFIGLHGVALPGPDRKNHVFMNIESSPTEIGKAQADYIVADSKGKGRAIILYDAQYAIARTKAQAMKAEFAKCTGCKLLEYANLPLSQMTTLMPQAMTRWTQKYGSQPFYVMTICDCYYDFAIPALRQAGVPDSKTMLLGSDGTAAAYDRIRHGDYQVVTVPEPAELQAYEAIDEFNRAFAKQKPVDYVPPVYLVTPKDVNAEGGKQNIFNPSTNYAKHYLSIWGVG